MERAARRYSVNKQRIARNWLTGILVILVALVVFNRGLAPLPALVFPEGWYTAVLRPFYSTLWLAHCEHFWPVAWDAYAPWHYDPETHICVSESWPNSYLVVICAWHFVGAMLWFVVHLYAFGLVICICESIAGFLTRIRIVE